MQTAAAQSPTFVEDQFGFSWRWISPGGHTLHRIIQVPNQIKRPRTHRNQLLSIASDDRISLINGAANLEQIAQLIL